MTRRIPPQALAGIFDKTGQGYLLSLPTLPGWNQQDCGGTCEFAGSFTAPLSGSYAAPCWGGGQGQGATGQPQCESISSQVYWKKDSSTAGWLFLWPWLEDVDWCYYNGTTFSCAPFYGYTDEYTPSGFPGGSMVLSANGSNLSSAVLWAIVQPKKATSYTDPASAPDSFKGAVRAYALTIPPTSSTAFSMTLEWSSGSQITFLGSIFALPTVVNGYLYVPTYNKGVLVFYPSS